MSQSPEDAQGGPAQDGYLTAFTELAQRIRNGASFSGRERNCAFLNTGTGYFADISAVSGFGQPADGRGMALTDWDHDGDLDVWLSNRSAPRVQFLQNQIPVEDTGWIAIRLRGDPAMKCPRDAIGSQVEVVLEQSGFRRIKTLHAGDGLMSQSSKWLHFGLGDGEGTLSSVRVRWAGSPSGQVEEFRPPAPNRRWLLVQGTGEARPVPARAATSIPAGPLALPEPTEVARIRLSQPLRIPELSYPDFQGQRQSLAALANQSAVLVNLWATWCPPCASELREFAEASEEFSREGIEVVALNVDHLGPDSAITALQAERALRDYGFSGRGGVADAQLVDLLEQSILKSVYRHHRMPVPVSFLIDRGGWLSAIYKGAVEVEQVIADRRELGKSPEAALAAAVPFPGGWARSHFPANPVAISAASMEGGYLEEARAVLEEYLEKHDAAPGNPQVPVEHKRNMQLAGVHAQIAEVALLEGKPALARDSYQESLRYNGRQVPVLNRLAWLLATSPDPAVRDAALALRHATFMMQAPGAAENPNLLSTLAAAYAAAGRFPEAVSTTERVLALLQSRGLQDAAAGQRKRLDLFQSGQALSLDPKRPSVTP